MYIISEYKSERVKKSGGGLRGNDLYALGEESENWYHWTFVHLNFYLVCFCFFN